MAAIFAHPDLRHPFEEKTPSPEVLATVIYNERRIDLNSVLDEPGLWVSPDDLTRINGFVLKPEGACLDALCIPVKAESNLLKTVDGKRWFNIAAFADLLAQPVVRDEETNTWSLGEIPLKRESMLTDAMAPDFELVDRQGKVIRMSDFKGKKALVITWSSW